MIEGSTPLLVNVAWTCQGTPGTDWDLLLRDVVAVLGLTIRNQSEVMFEGGGETRVLLLSESHISVHTWPESDFAVVELLSCKPISEAQFGEVKHMILQRTQSKHMQVAVSQYNEEQQWTSRSQN